LLHSRPAKNQAVWLQKVPFKAIVYVGWP